jgi:hypothetical protein
LILRTAHQPLVATFQLSCAPFPFPGAWEQEVGKARGYNVEEETVDSENLGFALRALPNNRFSRINRVTPSNFSFSASLAFGALEERSDGKGPGG